MTSPTSKARRISIGVDFGTESGRVLLLDLETGEEVAIEEVRYRHGVIDEHLFDSGIQLPADTALQDPEDYLEVLFVGIPRALAKCGVRAEEVIGIGVDFTACTVMPVLADGTPMCLLPEWRSHPFAWVKLWKHHSAQPVADHLNDVARARGESFLSRYGGRLSSEWYFPKLIETWLEDRALYDAMDAFVEATDWVVWQLTGTLARASSTAGYKACWSSREGLPPADFFEAAYPGFSAPDEKLGSAFFAPGVAAGTLKTEVAERLGLGAGVAVAVGNVDAFVALPALGVQQPGSFVMVIGTSICDLVIDSREIRMPGITGVVEDGFIPGYFGYEAGQAAVGDMLAWFGEDLLELGVDGAGWYAALERDAARLVPGASGLVALDWWNGNRTVLGDADLSGSIIGLSLSTSRAEIYRALLESIAFGTRRIIENFNAHGVVFDEIVACGGIAERSPLTMQLLADICKLPVAIPSLSQIPARGSALFGALAAGAARGGFADIDAAISALRPGASRRFSPHEATRSTYDHLYQIFLGLHDALGIDHVEWMHDLKRMRRDAGPDRDTAQPKR